MAPSKRRASSSTRARPSLSRWGFRLVEEQDVRLLCEAGREREFVVGEADLEQRSSGPGVGAWAADGLEALESTLLTSQHPGHPIEVGDHLGASELRPEGSQLTLQLDEVLSGCEDRLDRGPIVAGRVLVEVGDARLPMDEDVAAVRCLEPCKDLSSVDLPLPFAPTTRMQAPGSTVTSAPSRMRREPKDFVIERPASSVTGGGACASGHSTGRACRRPGSPRRSGPSRRSG